MLFVFRVFLFTTILSLSLTLLPKIASASETIKPTLEWKRSTEAQNKIVTAGTLGDGVNTALSLPTDSSQIVFDNGVSTPNENKTQVPAGNKWASWRQYVTAGNFCGPQYELRHFQVKFSLPAGLAVKKVILSSPYYTDPTLTQVIPINDNLYVFLNGTKIAQVGTDYGAANRGFHGIAPVANETDGWIANGDFGQNPANHLTAGENTLDLVAEERCLWGGLGNLELKLEVENTGLNVPYFNQTSFPWGPQEYDSGNSLSLFCGHTIAQCGCALTSSAMLLKYYGVDKAPNGQPTTPETLNNWLKANQGYDYGNLKWTSISSYAFKANQNFGTQKIKFVGFGNGPDDFTTLNNDLNNNKPVILEEPNHYVVATGIQNPTYTINDPRWSNRITLEAYGNHFRRMRRFEKTSTDLSTIYISTPSPSELFITDLEGRRAGKDPNTGTIYTEIPNSFYILEPTLVDDSEEDIPLPPENSGVNTLVIVNPQQGNFSVEVTNTTGSYDVSFSGYDQSGEISVQQFQGSGVNEYQLNYSPEPGSKISVTQIINIDIKPGSDQNPINLDSNGVIPVAILTTPSFDATQVDVSTVRFGPGAARETHNKGHLEDVDGDGDIDMVLHFKTQDAGIQNSDTQACLTGITLNGIPIQGCDTVRIVH